MKIRHVKCFLATAIVLAMVCGLVYVMVKAPVLIIIVGSSILATWAIRTLVVCLTSEGD